jgi:hypothetical protein
VSWRTIGPSPGYGPPPDRGLPSRGRGRQGRGATRRSAAARALAHVCRGWTVSRQDPGRCRTVGRRARRPREPLQTPRRLPGHPPPRGSRHPASGGTSRGFAEPVRAPAETAPAAAPARISPEELYADIADTSRLSGVYLAMVVLASIVAAIGLVRSNVAVVVGASGDGALAGTARSAGRSDLSRSADVNRGDVNAVPYPAGRAASRARRTEPLRTCRSRCGKGMVTPCRRQASSMAKFRSLLNLMGL